MTLKIQSKKMKKIIFYLLILVTNTAWGQGNPGFIGKKIAIGYTNQFCFLRSREILWGGNDKNILRTLTNNEFYVERSIQKFKSIAIHLTYQKVPLPYSTGENLVVAQFFDRGSREFYGVFNMNSGISDYYMMGIGIRYSMFSNSKTISAPIGLSQYLRLDVFENKLIENNYLYGVTDIVYTSNDYLHSEDYKYAKDNFNNKYSDTRATVVSFGYGVESKYPITKSVFFRLNGEMNFSHRFFKDIKENNSYSSVEYNTLSEDLRHKSLTLNTFRNLFVLGIGVGALL